MPASNTPVEKEISGRDRTFVALDEGSFDQIVPMNANTAIEAAPLIKVAALVASRPHSKSHQKAENSVFSVIFLSPLNSSYAFS